MPRANTFKVAARKIKRRFAPEPETVPEPQTLDDVALLLRADRVHALVEAVHGKVLFRVGAKIIVEIPADVAPGMPWGTAGFTAIYIGQSVRDTPRRVVGMNWQTIVCENDPVTTAFYKFEVDLRPRALAVETTPHATALAITAPVKPAGA